MVYEKSQWLSLIVYSLPFQLTAFFLAASRIDDMNEKKMITPAKGEPRVYKVFWKRVYFDCIALVENKRAKVVISINSKIAKSWSSWSISDWINVRSSSFVYV